jgi:hypothetical protein
MVERSDHAESGSLPGKDFTVNSFDIDNTPIKAAEAA